MTSQTSLTGRHICNHLSLSTWLDAHGNSTQGYRRRRKARMRNEISTAGIHAARKAELEINIARSKKAIAGIAQTGNDVGILVERWVNGSRD